MHDRPIKIDGNQWVKNESFVSSFFLRIHHSTMFDSTTSPVDEKQPLMLEIKDDEKRPPCHPPPGHCLPPGHPPVDGHGGCCKRRCHRNRCGMIAKILLMVGLAVGGLYAYDHAHRPRLVLSSEIMMPRLDVFSLPTIARVEVPDFGVGVERHGVFPREYIVTWELQAQLTDRVTVKLMNEPAQVPELFDLGTTKVGEFANIGTLSDEAYLGERSLTMEMLRRVCAESNNHVQGELTLKLHRVGHHHECYLPRPIEEVRRTVTVECGKIEQRETFAISHVPGLPQCRPHGEAHGFECGTPPHGQGHIETMPEPMLMPAEAVADNPGIVPPTEPRPRL